MVSQLFAFKAVLSRCYEIVIILFTCWCSLGSAEDLGNKEGVQRDYKEQKLSVSGQQPPCSIKISEIAYLWARQDKNKLYTVKRFPSIGFYCRDTEAYYDI